MEKIFWKGVFLSLVAVGFIVLTSSHALASGITITEKGTKGLGNAYAGGAAVAEDASAIYWNPAGLTRLPGKRLEVSLNLIRPSFEFENQGSTNLIGAPLTGGNGGDAGGVELFRTYSIHMKLAQNGAPELVSTFPLAWQQNTTVPGWVVITPSNQNLRP